MIVKVYIYKRKLILKQFNVTDKLYSQFLIFLLKSELKEVISLLKKTKNKSKLINKVRKKELTISLKSLKQAIKDLHRFK